MPSSTQKHSTRGDAFGVVDINQKYVGPSYRLSSHKNTHRMFRAHRILHRQAKVLQALTVASLCKCLWMVHESGNTPVQFEDASTPTRNNQHLVCTASTKTYKIALLMPLLVLLWA